MGGKATELLKSQEEKSKLQTEMKLSREEMELALQGVLQGRRYWRLEGIESMINEYGQQAYNADLKGVRVENSGGRIAEDGVEKNRRIRNHMRSKQQKRRKMTIASIYVYMMVDIDARTG